MTALLRPATAADAVAGAELQRTCWREAYGPIVDPALLDAQLADGPTWERRWQHPPPAGITRLVATYGDALVGFATSGAGRRDGDAEHELYGLYVLAAHHGTGLGQALLDASVPADTACSLWVLEDNARARAFYARNGFVPDGTRKRFEPLDAWELRLRRPRP